jgi:hypothetical protein
MKLNFKLDLKFLSDLPRHTALGLVGLCAALVVFAVAFPWLGGAQRDAKESQQRLNSELNAQRGALQQSETDRKYILENRDLYDSLLKGDQLVPHARRAAVRQLQTLGANRGLTSLSYSFMASGDQTLAGAQSQPTSKDYKVSVETVDLKVEAPLDVMVFEFMADLAEDFPGAAVLQEFQIARVATVTEEALQSVSSGTAAGLVSGEIKFIWRTAQATEQKTAEAKP